ncbi:MAG TPA: acyl-CoA thioesterase [Tissierellia bacterium]|nr:acyl-CoA thioesterase [Tissierellia bacterium]
MIYQTTIEPRYAETDQMGIIYHANYIVWFEIARTKLMDIMDFDYAQVEAKGFFFPVLRMEARYHKPAVYGRAVSVSCLIPKYTGVRICYEYEVRDKATNELLVTGYSESGVTDKTMRVTNLARAYPEFDAAIREYRDKCLAYKQKKASE